MLDNSDAGLIAYDYSSSGHQDYLFCYRTAGNASITQPASTQGQCDSTAEVLIKEPGNWYAVCYVAPNTLKNGSTIMNNVTWGPSVACNIQ
jgi:hypothetical protein